MPPVAPSDPDPGPGPLGGLAEATVPLLSLGDTRERFLVGSGWEARLWPLVGPTPGGDAGSKGLG